MSRLSAHQTHEVAGAKVASAYPCSFVGGWVSSLLTKRANQPEQILDPSPPGH